MTSRKFQLFVVLPLICIAVFTAFSPSLSGEFLYWDDDTHILANKALQEGRVLRFWTEPYFGFYIPLTYTVWTWLAPYGPHVLHGLNLLIHAANTFLVYLLALTWLRSRPNAASSALAGALIFAVHPLQAAAVSWISGLRDLLSAFFALTAIWLYLNRHRRWALGAYTLSLLSKPVTAVVPFILAALAYADRRTAPQRTLLRLWPWLALAAAQFYLTQISQGVRAQSPVPLWQRPLVAADAAGFYVHKWLWPFFNLSADYGRVDDHALARFTSDPMWLWLLVPVAAYFAFPWRRFRAGLWVTLLWLGPVIGLFSFAYQQSSTVADHYFYGPMVGVSLAACAVFVRVTSSQVRMALLVMLTSVLMAWTATSRQRAEVWVSQQNLFSDILRQNPGSYLAELGLGAAAMNRGDYAKALEHYDRALILQPGNVMAIKYRGLALLLMGRPQETIALLEPILNAARPEEWRTYEWDEYASLVGLAYWTLGLEDQAFSRLCQALRMNPENQRAIMAFSKKGFSPREKCN